MALVSELLAAQSTTPWLAKEEAVGNVFSTWPMSFKMLLGHKSVLMLGQQPNVHTAVRRVFTDSLSPGAVVRLEPFIDSCLEQRVRRWDTFASSGKTLNMHDEINSFTLEVITYSFLGDYGTGEVITKLQRIIPAVSEGLMSKPRRLPWPLNRLPAHKYGTAMDARKEFDAEVGGMLRQRRLDLSAEAHGKDGAGRTAGVLDAMLAMQARQVEAGGPIDEEMEYDDAFILDNNDKLKANAYTSSKMYGIVGLEKESERACAITSGSLMSVVRDGSPQYLQMYTALFAGYDTTSVTISRMLQFLTSDDSKNQSVVEKLFEELNTADAVLQEYLTERVSTRSSEHEKTGPAAIMQKFPLLQAVMHESNRLFPAISGTFRVAGKDLEFSGFLIPEGETISWNLTNGNKAESLYPEPARFCPFRFFHGNDDQPRPLMFGFGRHSCPGRELAKIEIVMFMETFLSKYTYRLTKEQVATLPDPDATCAQLPSRLAEPQREISFECP